MSGLHMAKNPWLVGAPLRERRLRMYCFAYAGGNAAVFQPWQARLAPDIEVCAVQLPGRGMRFGETLFTAMPALVEALAPAISHPDGVPFVFFGHSLGALVAFELARHVARHRQPGPQHLIVSGCAAPRDRPPRRALHALPEEEFIAALREYNGTPAEILEHRELMDLVSPTLRADFAIVETYEYRTAPPLAIPISVFAGTGDDRVSPEHAKAWSKETTRPTALHWFDGDHFFVNSARDAVLEKLRTELAYLVR